MATCEMCGVDSKLCLARIEGVELNVCKDCSSYGQIIKRPKKIVKKKKSTKRKESRTEKIQVITKDYSKIIRGKREKLGLKQKEFAKFIAERESIIHKIESGSYKPSLELARKMEKQLNISLVEEKEIKPQKLKSKKTEFTIGDIIKSKD